ncbi:MAG: hypothetical protein K2H93_03055 [Oscillospiraceae bacterium]|nr:hypothetical protein [Oscillospiraceae bacterium]
MNMKRIVFVAIGILIMLLIMGFTIYNINHIDEINQKRREQDKGEAIASRMVATTATTSIWDSLRTTETETGNIEETSQEIQETIQESGEMLETEFTQEYEIENQVSTETITEIITEPVTEDEKYSVCLL